jgi:hypothetical protein
MIPPFKSANSYYHFEEHVLRSARYVRDPEDEAFLDHASYTEGN